MSYNGTDRLSSHLIGYVTLYKVLSGSELVSLYVKKIQYLLRRIISNEVTCVKGPIQYLAYGSFSDKQPQQ